MNLEIEAYPGELRKLRENKGWVSLTEDERNELFIKHYGWWKEYGQAIEAKLKEKNT